MHAFSTSVSKALEYPTVLAKISEGCQTELGRSYLQAFQPLYQIEPIRVRQLKTQAILNHRLKYNTAPIPNPEKFYDAFQRFLVEKQILSGLELSSVGLFLSQVARFQTYLFAASMENDLEFWRKSLNPMEGLRTHLLQLVDDEGNVLDAASPELKSCREGIHRLNRQIRTQYEQFIRRHDIEKALQDPIVTEREGRWVVPIRKSFMGVVHGIIHGQSASGATLYVEPEEAVQKNNDLKKMILQEEEIVWKILRATADRIWEQREILSQTIETCREIDAHWGLSEFALRYRARLILPSETPSMQLDGIRHPLLCFDFGDHFEEHVIPLNLSMPENQKILVVSGPNAGGKTVVLKSIGLVCAMAQAGLPVVSGASTQLPLIACFETDLMEEQSLIDHRSTYEAKLLALKRMLDQASKNSLLLMDELGSGTDPEEGGALSWSILEYLHATSTWVFATTHQPFLKKYLYDHPEIGRAAMIYDAVREKPTFQLKQGSLGTSNALQLAATVGIPEAIIQRAKLILPDPEKNFSNWLNRLEHEYQEMHEIKLKETSLFDEAKQLKQKIDEAQHQWQVESIKIRERAYQEANQLILETRKTMEHFIQQMHTTPPTAFQKKESLNTIRIQLEQALKRNQNPTIGAQTTTHVQPGEYRKFLATGQLVKVVAVDPKRLKVQVQNESGMKFSCGVQELSSLLSNNPQAPKKPLVKRLNNIDQTTTLDIDIRGYWVDQALPILEKFLDQALISELPFIRVIHGKGTGKLKQAVEHYLWTRKEELTFQTAPLNQGGSGVTVIYFKKDF